MHRLSCAILLVFPFSFHVPAPTQIYTLSLHDALPIWIRALPLALDYCFTRQASADEAEWIERRLRDLCAPFGSAVERTGDRKSTRLNSSHANISYAVFCLKKKKKKTNTTYENKITQNQ